MPLYNRAMPVIEIENLSKSYRVYQKQEGLLASVTGLFRREHKDVHAVREVNLTVEKGEFVAFLGPNGAGKTTTLKLLSGIIYPSGGTARVMGHVPWEREIAYRRRFALVMGQKNQLWWDLPALESFRLHQQIYRIEPQQYQETLDELSELLDIGRLLRQPVRDLSLGERMKMELIAALLHQPKVLFLDEPTIGLDVVSQKTVREFLKEYNAIRGTTVLLTSHYMADIEALCKRVIIIDRGRLFFDGQLSEVLDRFADFKLITIHFASGTNCPRSGLERFGQVVECSDVEVTLKVKRDRVIAACQALLDELPVTDIDIQEVPIEEVVRQIFVR